MNSIMEYKGYYAKIEYSVEDKVLYGKIEGINDLVTFESRDVDEIEKEFRDAVDDYLAMCEDLGQCPDKTYSGTFNVRINPKLHRSISLKAFRDGITLNGAVEKAISSYVEGIEATATKMSEVVEYILQNAPSKTYGESAFNQTIYMSPYGMYHGQKVEV